MPAMRRAVVLAGLCAGCGRFGFDATASPDAPSFGPWSAAQPLVALNSPQDDSDPELRADGLELFFHSSRGGTYDLYVSRRAAPTADFGAPRPVTELNTAGDELGPTLTGDGLTVLFGDGQDIVAATRPALDAPFGPRSVIAALSSTEIDTAPAISGDGRVAMVVRGVAAMRDIYLYTRDADGPIDQGWSSGTRVTELASPLTESSPDLDETGLVVYFHSDRLTGTSDDIYVATRASPGEPFGPPIVSDISTALDEGDPTLTADQRTLVFHRRLELQIATR